MYLWIMIINSASAMLKRSSLMSLVWTSWQCFQAKEFIEIQEKKWSGPNKSQKPASQSTVVLNHQVKTTNRYGKVVKWMIEEERKDDVRYLKRSSKTLSLPLFAFPSRDWIIKLYIDRCACHLPPIFVLCLEVIAARDRILAISVGDSHGLESVVFVLVTSS